MNKGFSLLEVLIALAVIAVACLGLASAFATSCHEVTGGVPFLVEELVRAIANEGIEPTAPSSSRLADLAPHAVSQSVVQRLARVSATARELALDIERAGIAMQLLATADILAEQPGGEEFACERYRYVLATYPDTEAALQSESRLGSLCEERSGS